MPASRIRSTVGGVAVVCCVHDREKRQIPDPDAALRLGADVGIEYDPRRHKFHMCACCENVFVSEDDTPRFCYVCSGELVHSLGGPLPEPAGVI